VCGSTTLLLAAPVLPWGASARRRWSTRAGVAAA